MGRVGILHRQLAFIFFVCFWFVVPLETVSCCQTRTSPAEIAESNEEHIQHQPSQSERKTTAVIVNQLLAINYDLRA